ncbi:tRNA/rRNA methyltransferase [Candidatus Kinetoplastibacterium desouzaii TCC079E]|uniref:tRNA (cytidine/uridine-2'-O-)-methyltransferase TrmJ n=1 Tax=Candidatus Kinetoplastidibacterium desouzai TCC079E TaxID=1208919 RepID=M1L1T5_9PROT|nr:TrmJ/YjtD family RNA methyltransferase [Candidatus Kinetoplastibacterium desouzaii]AGF46713.1 tRNA/rRNA methyltransferase [Candidatus Kinetoplastibacterium desouzaii TCC079E]
MEDIFSKVNFILVEPTHPGNVGSSARALKNMGFSNLIIVNPKNNKITENIEAIKLASNAQDILIKSKIFTSLEQALENTTFSIALTARNNRNLSLKSYDIREVAKESYLKISELNQKIAFVLGSENNGLNNQQISMCNCICHIPTNIEYQSINLSHAIQIAAWELRYLIINYKKTDYHQTLSYKSIKNEKIATSEDIFNLLKNLEKSLIHINFLNPLNPRRLMLKMKNIFMRSSLQKNEVNILQGICKRIISLKKQHNKN